jgi:cation:H+ antiporter
MLIQILLLVVALGAVVKSADWFLGAAEKIGLRIGLSPFILGVVLVGFGTSLPELTTSLAAISNGANDIALANIAGSNIANVLLIIGLATLMMGTIKLEKNLIDLDLPLLIGTTILFVILLADGGLGLTDGIILLLALAGYIAYNFNYKEDKEYHQGIVKLISMLTKTSTEKVEKHENTMTKYTIPVAILSVVLLGIASSVVVTNLLAIVQQINIGVDVVAFFVLAIGTSLPELVVSIKSLRKGQSDVVMGNIVGSCMFNMLLIGGLASVLSPQTMSPQVLTWSIIGLLVSTGLLVVASISKRIHIWEGYTFLLLYVVIGLKIAEV